MSLDVPSDQVPEHLCIVSQSRSCPDGSEDSNGRLLAEVDCATRELSDLQSVGSLPSDLSNEDVVIVAPAKDTAERYDNGHIEMVHLDRVHELWSALQSLARSNNAQCYDEHDGCTPRVRLVKFAKSGRIVCGHDHSNHNGRVAIVELSYHVNEPQSGVQEVELQGTTATLWLQRELPATSGAHSAVLGGDYVFSPIASDGTNEHIAITLQPRCAQFAAVLPPHSATIPFSNATIHLDTLGSTRHAPNVLSQCIPKLQQNILPINIPYINNSGIKHLVVSAAPERARNASSGDPASGTTVLEATWYGALPPNPLKMGVSRFEFTWRRDCLTGEWPLPQKHSHNDESEDICPRATIDELLRCSIIDRPDLSTCSYRCETDEGSPLQFPVSVRFDRMAHYDDKREQLLYSWHDTLSYPEQKLNSFVEPHERKVIVEVRALDSWRSQPGNEIERVEISPDSSDRSQTIFFGYAPPARTAIAVPNATCTSRFAVEIFGARSFARGDQHLATSGNLVLTTPADYQNRFHPVLSIGVGFLFPQNEPLGNPRGEPHVSIGAGGEIYYSDSARSTFELGIVYEPGYHAYGTIPHPQTTTQSKANVPYQRLMLEFAGAYWGPDRTWQVGVRAGGGAGGPIFGNSAEKVGGFHKFLFGGLLGRWHFYPTSLHASLQLDWGILWGEGREYFGTDADGDADPSRFHGESAVAELRLLEMYTGLRWRISFR